MRWTVSADFPFFWEFVQKIPTSEVSPRIALKTFLKTTPEIPQGLLSKFLSKNPQKLFLKCIYKYFLGMSLEISRISIKKNLARIAKKNFSIFYLYNFLLDFLQNNLSRFLQDFFQVLEILYSTFHRFNFFNNSFRKKPYKKFVVFKNISRYLFKTYSRIL